LQIRISVELELRTSPNFRTSFFVEIANFTELQNVFHQFSKDAAFWKNPEKNWPKFGRNLAKIRQNLGQILRKFAKKQQNFQQFLTKILRLENGAKECIV
jgi:hypothetical protein